MCECDRYLVILFLSVTLFSPFISGHDHNLLSSINSITHSQIFQKSIYKGKQFQIIESIKFGTQLSLDHCKKQFQRELWNCPDIELTRQFWKNSVTREASYTAAIVAAGITYSLIKNCTEGFISECGKCKSNIYKSNSDRDWIIEECSDNMSFSCQLTKKLLKSLYKNEDDITQATLHNHYVGIFAVKNTLKLSCKCHGISGSCTLKSCKKQLAPFQEIAVVLKSKYKKAARLRQNSVQRIDWKKVPKQRMIYLVDSPDYCRINNTTGWMGTSGRVCSQIDIGRDRNEDDDTCNKLCKSCGHIIRSKKRVIKWRCNCQFHWCCKVTCETCSKMVDEYYCEATDKSM